MSELIIQFINNTMRLTGLYPLSMTLPDKLFERVWHENQDYVNALMGDDFIVIHSITVHHMGGSIEILRENKKVIDMVANE